MTRIIIADDEEFVRIFLKETLKEFGFDVVAEVENGSDLIDIMQDVRPDILLLDINMPNMTGRDFIENYANDFEKTCIIVLTSLASANYIKYDRVNAVLRKDIEMIDIINAIQDTWDKFKRENF